MNTLETILVKQTGLKKEHIRNILKLLDDGATIPFIARYRKEMTGSASDEVLREFEGIYLAAKKLLERKAEVARLIEERGTLSDAIRQSINQAESLRILEDIYRPYKEKKSSRAATAIKNGLTPLADTLASGRLTLGELRSKAATFVKGEIGSVDEAVKGAQDILAERYAEQPRERETIRSSMMRFGTLEVKKTKNLNEKGVYANFVDHSEKVFLERNSEALLLEHSAELQRHLRRTLLGRQPDRRGLGGDITFRNGIGLRCFR